MTEQSVHCTAPVQCTHDYEYLGTLSLVVPVLVEQVCAGICYVSDVTGVLQILSKMPAKQRKIAVMGSRSVGKSSLAIQFVQVSSSLPVIWIRTFFPDVDSTSVFFIRIRSLFFCPTVVLTLTGIFLMERHTERYRYSVG